MGKLGWVMYDIQEDDEADVESMLRRWGTAKLGGGAPDDEGPATTPSASGGSSTAQLRGEGESVFRPPPMPTPAPDGDEWAQAAGDDRRAYASDLATEAFSTAIAGIGGQPASTINRARRGTSAVDLLALKKGDDAKRMRAENEALRTKAMGDAATSRAAAATAAEAERARRRDEDVKWREAEAARHGKEHDETVGVTASNAAATRALAAATLNQRETEHGDKQDRDIETDVQALSKHIGDDPVLIGEKAKRIREILSKPKYGKDLPGVGALDARKPDLLTSDAGVSLRSDAAALVGVLLRIQSGTGVSDKERERAMAMYGAAPDSSEAAFRQGMAKLPHDIAKAVRTKFAGFRPDVVKRYLERGGLNPDTLTGPSAAQASPPTPDIPPKPRRAYNPKTKQWLELRGGQWVEVQP